MSLYAKAAATSETIAVGARIESQVKSMDALLSELDKRLSCIRECTGRVIEFRHRLLNPRPADASKAPTPEPSPQTVEGRLAATVRYAELILSDLNDVCNDLDRAA